MVEWLIETTLPHKNASRSYGFTLVAGLPLPQEVSANVYALQVRLEEILPEQFVWYTTGHLHITLVAPLRGRYRQQLPIQRNELPVDLGGFIHDLVGYFNQLQPFSLELAGPYLTDEGLILATAACTRAIQKDLAEILRKYPELDHPVADTGLHLTIGYLKAIEHQQNSSDVKRLKGEIDKLYKPYIGEVMVDQVWLVHYSNRTLNQVIGKIPITLDKLNVISAPDFLGELGIR